jgi:hypothetical protein
LVTKNFFVSHGVRKTLPDANYSKLEKGKKKHFIWAPEKTESSLQETPGGDKQDSDRKKISVNMC